MGPGEKQITGAVTFEDISPLLHFPFHVSPSWLLCIEQFFSTMHFYYDILPTTDPETWRQVIMN
jgi:hypothetical protein